MMTKFEEYTQKSTLITMNKREDIVKDISTASSDQDLMEFYSNTYEHVDVAKFLRTERKERLLGLLNLIEQGESYIDIGCANGAHMEELYKRGIYGIGLDVSIPNILRGLDQHPYLKFVHGFAEDIPFGDHYFDVAILGDILEHFRDQKCALSEILRVVKKGFVICFPNDTKYTVEHINPVTIASFAKLCQQFALHVVYFDKDGNRLSDPDESFYWVFARAEKTEATEKICLEIQAERNRDKARVLESDQWKLGECHDRHQTEQDRFTITSLALMGKEILEVACGNGDLSVFLAQKGFHVTGIDISEVGISHAISYAKQEKVANMTNFLVMDGTKLNFDDNTFDSVIFPEVFEHVVNSRRYISEAIRVLKPGGRIFISVPDTLEISWPGHIRLFTKETLSVELDQYTDNIIWYEMNFKKWLLCAFTPNAKKGNDVVENLPLVNILMPTYNRADVIHQAIASIIHQTYKNWKLLVLNDGGENINEIVTSFHESRLSYHEFEHQGKAATINHGIQLVETGYIAYMDDDDQIFPNHIESLVRAAILYQKDFVFSDTYLTSVEKKSNRVLHKTVENTTDVDVASLKFSNKINHKQILHTKRLADRVGLYDERLHILIDYDYIKRLALLTNPFHIKLITGNHFLYYDNEGITTITGLWQRDQKAVGESLSVIFSKYPQDMYDLYVGFQQQTQQIQQQTQQIQQQTQQIQQQTQQIQTMEHTLSWRITKPLRIVKNLTAFKEQWSYQDASWKGKFLRFCAKTLWSQHVIRQSGLFDQEYYLKQNPDVAQAGVNPLRHFLRHGGFEGRNPHPDFDSTYYFYRNPDIKTSKINPLLHYLIYGIYEGRTPNRNFNTAFYLESNPDVKQSGIPPFLHYVRYGKQEGRQPFCLKQAKQLYERVHFVEFQNEYEKWVYRNRLTSKMERLLREELQKFSYTPTFSFVIPVYNTPEALLIKALESIKIQMYEYWEACIVNDGSSTSHVDQILRRYAERDRRFRYKSLDNNQGIVGASNEALKMVTGEYVIFMDHDDTIEKDILLQITKYLQDHRDVDILYTDNDKIDVADNYLMPQFKPDWSPELMYSYCYVIHAKVFSKRIIDKTGIFREGFDGSQDYDYFLRAIEFANTVTHIPLVLYHWREVPGQSSSAYKSIENGRRAVLDSLKRQGIDWVEVVQADFAKKSQNGIYKLVPNISFHEKISIIINVKNNYKLVKACIDSIESKTTHPYYEIIITDDESDDPKTIAYLQRLSKKYTVLWLRREQGQGFNFSRLNNIAVQSATGEYIVFLNGDTEVISANWLEEMLLYCRMPKVAIVGAKLIFPNETIQHAGVIKGFFNGLAYPAFKNLPINERGYMDFAVVSRNYSCVTAACLMIKKAIFLEVNGFDEMNFPIAYNDVDLCLQVLQKNYRVVYNPYVELFHREGAFRGGNLSGSKNILDEISFREKWRFYQDIYYNLNQSLDYENVFKEQTKCNNRLVLFDLSTQKLKVLSVSHNLNFEGAPLSKFKLDHYLSKQTSIHLDVISLQKGPLFSRYEQENISTTILNWGWNGELQQYHAFIQQLRRYIEDGGYHVVFANTLETFWAIDAAYQAKVPSIWNIRESVDYSSYFDQHPIADEVKGIAKRAFLQANRNVFVCHATAKMFQQYDHYGVSDVIYNGIDLYDIEMIQQVNKLQMKQTLHIPDDKTIISIIGTTCPRKGQLDFAKAAIQILRKRKDVCFLIVGARQSEYLNQIQEEARDESAIYIIPETPDALKFFHISDIFVCASYNESFPRIILEAMAFGLPIVTTPVFGIAEQIVDDTSGLFFQPGDIMTMQHQIERLLDDSLLRETLGKNALLTVHSKFSEHEMCEKYARLIKTIAFEDVNYVEK
ncbi:glycosyl transferase, group 1 [Candidatus Moduliflexus flocculans]|uniref:Glycosyl transferase, group 1 n=1 Tax=Candidatus Moduliflexus flocculans TaxID=1499966 RepID=A0A081BRQ9_9BACT|nr:glycosyl transferase, group 1 [Candidatus Moduliflexus flocculans]